MTKWKVGSVVVVSKDANGWGGGTFAIKRVGQKFITIAAAYGRERRFRVTDGVEDTDSGTRSVARTPEEHNAWIRLSDAESKLDALTRQSRWYRGLSAEALERMAAAIEHELGARR